MILDKNETEPQVIVDRFYENWKPIFMPNPVTNDPIIREHIECIEDWYDSPQTQELIKPHVKSDIKNLITPTRTQDDEDFSKNQLLAPIIPEDLKYFITRLKK